MQYITVAKMLLQEICKKDKSYKVIREMSEQLTSILRQLGDVALTFGNDDLRHTINGKGGYPKKTGLLEAMENIPKTLKIDGELACIFLLCVSFQMIEQVIDGEHIRKVRNEGFINKFEELYGSHILNNKLVVDYLGGFDQLDEITKHIVVEKSLGLITDVYHSIAQGSKGTDNADLKELVSIYTAILYDDNFNLSGSFFELHKMIHYGEFGTKDRLIQYLGVAMGIVHAINGLQDISDEMKSFLKDLKQVGIILGADNITLGEVEITMDKEDEAVAQ